MKRLLLLLALALSPTPAFAQCSGVFQPGTVCGNDTLFPAPPAQVVIPGTIAGTVRGPVTSVLGDVAEWNDTAGTLLKDVTPTALIDQICATDNETLIRLSGTWQCGITTVGNFTQLTINGGTLAPGAMVFTVNVVQPATPTAAQVAIQYNITSAGSAPQTNTGFIVQYFTGYTGSARTQAAAFNNSAQGTGTVFIPVAPNDTSIANIGTNNSSLGPGSGVNIGDDARAGDGSVNIGMEGLAHRTTNSAINIGLLGTAANLGTSSSQVGGYFTLSGTQPTNATPSAALIADNGPFTNCAGLACPIQIWMSNGTPTAQVTPAGGFSGTGLNVNAGSLAPSANATSITATQPANPTTPQAAVTFNVTGNGNAAVQNNALSVLYSPGYTGPVRNTGLVVNNSNAGTGNVLVPPNGANSWVGNGGTNSVANGLGGLNVGAAGLAVQGLNNAGLLGLAQTPTAGMNVGVTGSGGNISGLAIGGWFSLNQTTNPTVSAALIADNGTNTFCAGTACPIALFQSAGVTLASVGPTGTVDAPAFSSTGIPGVSCAAGTLNLTTAVVTNGIITHC